MIEERLLANGLIDIVDEWLCEQEREDGDQNPHRPMHLLPLEHNVLAFVGP